MTLAELVEPWDGPTIVINGKRLSVDEVMTLRAALFVFLNEIQGRHEVYGRLAILYREPADRVAAMMFES